MASLRRTMEQGIRNGVAGLRLIDRQELRRLVPKAVGEFAMFSERSGIVDPFLYTIALAENAALNGAAYLFDNEVTAIKRTKDGYRVQTTRSEYAARWVINSAGLGCGAVSDMLGLTGYRVVVPKGITSFWTTAPAKTFPCRSTRAQQHLYGHTRHQHHRRQRDHRPQRGSRNGFRLLRRFGRHHGEPGPKRFANLALHPKGGLHP
jgi:glycine/D-amino acid oxidase-like deaminating enzyme